MSEVEDSTAGRDGSEGVLMVETNVSQHRSFDPVNLQDSTDTHLRVNKAPAVSTLEVELTERDQALKEGSEKRQDEDDSVDTTDKQKQHITSKSFTKIDNTLKPSPIPQSPSAHLAGPIPPEVLDEQDLAIDTKTKLKQKHEEHESVDEIVTDLTDEAAIASSNVLQVEEGETSDMAQEDTRPFDMSRAVRQLFCCARPSMAPSEMDISYTRDHAI